MIEEPSRNDPCPCGSGKKYKKCCLLKTETSRPLSRTLLGQACVTAFKALLAFSNDSGNPPTIPKDLPHLKLTDKRQVDGLFHELMLPWLFYQDHRQDPETLDGPSEETVAATYLRQRGQKLDGMARRYMEAARSEPFSFWQVLEPSPGSGLLLKDMITGDERFVADLSLSRSTVRWDILFAHVVGLDGLHIFSAIGIFPLKPAQFGEAIARYAKLPRRKDDALPFRHFLFKFQQSFLRHYLESVGDMLNAPPPELRNMDGDELVAATSVYTFDPARRSDVIAALTAMEDLNAEGDEDGKTRFTWIAVPENPAHKDKVLKGYIRVGPDRLESECNSKERDKTLRERLLKQVDTMLSHPKTTLKPFRPDPEQMKQSPAGQQPTGSLDLANLSEEDRNRVEEMISQKFMAWADMEIPALNGKTPRQTVRTKTGKIKIATMINEWENQQGHMSGPQFRFDFNKLRTELQIPLE